MSRHVTLNDLKQPTEMWIVTHPGGDFADNKIVLAIYPTEADAIAQRDCADSKMVGTMMCTSIHKLLVVVAPALTRESAT